MKESNLFQNIMNSHSIKKLSNGNIKLDLNQVSHDDHRNHPHGISTDDHTSESNHDSS